MAKFLNTEKLLIQIPNLIKSSNNELVIIVPFISLSKSIEEALLTADKKDIETIIICRYSEVKQKDRQFLNSLNNINLFSHPNVHSKCYYNRK